MAYKLKLLEESHIHLVFHISLFKQKVGDSTFHTNELPTTTEDNNIILHPETILDTPWVKKGFKLIEESLVKWKHLPAEDVTWENTKDLLEQFASLNLRIRFM